VRGLFRSTAEATVRRFHKPWAAVLVICVAGVLATVTGLAEGGARLARGLSFFASVGIGLAVPSGIIAGERASGVILLWIQQPGSLLGFYAKRMLLVQAVNLGLMLPFGFIAAGGAVIEGEPVALAFRYGVGMVLVGVLCGFLTIAISSWGVRKDAFVGLAWTIVSVSLGSMLVFDSVRSGGTGWVRYFVFPLDALQQLTTGSAIGEGLVTIFGQMLALAAIAALGLVWLDHRPLPSSSFQAGG
jgi:hypothetical protein